MGAVYEAVDRDTGGEVALKVIAFKKNSSPESRKRQLERFGREARALAMVEHPRLVRFFEQGEIEGRAYFTMELVRGTTLRDRLQFQGALSVPELRRLGVQLCEALDHMHGRGVIHRDVKPDNVMLMPDGGARLMDFGIAMVAADQQSSLPGGFEGSPAYMSPEQVSAQAVDFRTDLYSLSVTLYEAATGARAYAGDSIAAITHRVVHEYPPPPAGLPASLQAILMRAMAKDPNSRYGSAAEMARDILEGRTPIVAIDPVGGAAGPPQFVLPSSQPRTVPSACHPVRPAVGRCGNCGLVVCAGCLVELANRGVYCRGCAFPRVVSVGSGQG